MSIYIVLCLIVGIGTGVLAARSGQLGWFIGGATALALLLGVPRSARCSSTSLRASPPSSPTPWVSTAR